MNVKGKDFVVFIDHSTIQQKIKELARAINNDYRDKDPVFVAVLNGSFMFASDLLKNLDIDCKISFIKVSSYQATLSTGFINNLIGLNEDLAEREVIIIEDIVDTGNTISNILESISAMKPKNIEIATLLFKPNSLKKETTLKYVGFEIPDKFVVGYGLDYEGYGRNLPDIYQITE